MNLHAFSHWRLDAYMVNIHHTFVHWDKMEETDPDIQLLGVGNMSDVFTFLICFSFLIVSSNFFPLGMYYACDRGIINFFFFFKSEHYY